MTEPDRIDPTKRRQSFLREDVKSKKKTKTKENNMENLKKDIEFVEHKLSLTELCDKYKTNPESGLTATKAAELLKQNGPNRLTPPKEIPQWLKFLKQLTNGFALLLWAGAILSLISFIVEYSQDKHSPLTSIYLAIILVLVILLTGTLQYYQESKSGKIIESFNKMMPQEAIVIRDGQKQNMPADQLVLGDVVHVQIGNKIPADIRIVSNSGLKVDNSSLTGETEPQSRSTECTHDNPLETKNLAFFSTFAVEGSAVGIVVRCGDDTAMGRIASLASGLEKRETHLAMELHHFIRIVIGVALSLGIIFFLILIGIGRSVVDSFIYFIGVVVGLVPESLMACLTISLTLTAKRMARKNCLVKHLEAIESLGSIGVICSDKTGTLTMNRMTVSHMWIDNRILKINLHNPNESSHSYENTAFDDDEENLQNLQTGDFKYKDSNSWNMLMRCGMLCSRAEFRSDPENMALDVLKRACVGDASETAILQYSEFVLGNVTQYRSDNHKVFEIPFNSTNKYQVSVHEIPNQEDRLLVMKGAPERILARCQYILLNGKDVELTEEWRQRFNKAYEDLGGMGERVLGFCDRIMSIKEYPKDYVFQGDNPNEFPPTDCRFLGFVSMIDPPKPNVPEAISKCHSAGIRVFMVTGDHPITAKAIAKAVGIIHEETREDIAHRLKVPIEQVDAKDAQAIVLHGSQLAEMNANDLNSILVNYKEIVFARTSPQQKLLIVEGCQKLGVLVGVTGDGVNDSPAMKKADIGISMGITGSDVSKQVADMVLLDDNFATIVTGIEEGRLLFDNISKIVRYTFTKNMAILSAFFLYLLVGNPLPISTITILCIDLGTDVLPMLSLSYEKPEAGIMKRRPRDPIKDRMANQHLISYCYGQISLIEAAGGFFAFSVVLTENGFFPTRLLGIRDYWDSENINDLRDSYGQEWTYDQRSQLERTAQTAFYVGMVVGQLFNLLTCKTKRASVFRHGFRNMRLNIAIFLTLGVACFLIYVPGLNRALNLVPLRFLWWLPASAFGVFLFTYTEIIKFLVRKTKGGFFEREWAF